MKSDVPCYQYTHGLSRLAGEIRVWPGLSDSVRSGTAAVYGTYLTIVAVSRRVASPCGLAPLAHRLCASGAPKIKENDPRGRSWCPISATGTAPARGYQ